MAPLRGSDLRRRRRRQHTASGGVASAYAEAGKCAASALADVGLLFDHGAVKPGTVAGNDLEQFHCILHRDSLRTLSIAQRRTIVERPAICYSAAFPTRSR